MTDSLRDLSLEYRWHLQRIAEAPNEAAKTAAEADLAVFLQRKLTRVEDRYPDWKARQAGEDDDAES